MKICAYYVSLSLGLGETWLKVIARAKRRTELGGKVEYVETVRVK